MVGFRRADISDTPWWEQRYPRGTRPGGTVTPTNTQPPAAGSPESLDANNFILPTPDLSQFTIPTGSDLLSYKGGTPLWTCLLYTSPSPRDS